MVIKASGSLAMSEIVTEFGGTVPHSLSEYNRGGAYVPNITQNNSVVTGASSAQSFSNYYNKVKILTQNVIPATPFSIDRTSNADYHEFGGDIPWDRGFVNRNSGLEYFYTTPNLENPTITITAVGVKIGAGAYRHSDKGGGWTRSDQIRDPGIRVYRTSDNVLVKESRASKTKVGDSSGDARKASVASNTVSTTIPAFSFAAAPNTKYKFVYTVDMLATDHRGDRSLNDYLWQNADTPTISTVIS